jgi:uronate dehydrogenase
MSETILITGAAGNIGRLLRVSLRRPGRHLRLLDTKEQVGLEPGEQATLLNVSFQDDVAFADACRDVDALIHLGGLSTAGYSWREYLEVNINGTFDVLEAVRRASVPRVIYASSHHVAGFHPNNEEALDDYLFPRPDTLYGVSKVASENLCSLYHDRYGIDVVCLRIGSYRDRPTDWRALWNWLSPGDCARLFDAALGVESPNFRVVWGVSKNTRRIMSLAEGEAIGYFPLDDAERYIDAIAATPLPDDPRVRDFVGGPYVAANVDDPHESNVL